MLTTSFILNTPSSYRCIPLNTPKQKKLIGGWRGMWCIPTKKVMLPCDLSHGGILTSFELVDLCSL